MKLLLLFFAGMLCACTVHAQYIFQAKISGKEGFPLPSATASIRQLNKIQASDTAGYLRLTDIPSGPFEVTFSFVGYIDKSVRYIMPADTAGVHQVSMEPDEEEEEEEEVIVNATRLSRSIAAIPTRVETISGEELQEKGNMKPGDIRMLLSESTGIQTQQTSATTYNSSIRIQGLDGRYTQLLRDGLPLYSGFSGGLSLMQVAPLDLKQVEVIKGASSTLYGGGAIAGLVNLVSKSPGNKRELSFFSNVTSAAGLDLSGFYSERYRHTGLTVFGSANIATPYDPAGIGLTAIPRYTRYTLNPRFFVYGNKTTANLGLSYITEKRLGGSMDYIKNDGPGYYERNHTDRITGQTEVRHVFSEKASLVFKSSYSRFARTIRIPSYTFEALQQSSFTEANYTVRSGNMHWIFGTNLVTDQLQEQRRSSSVLRDYSTTTAGLFVQQNWMPEGKFSFETGLRGDWVNHYGLQWLPRVSVMYKPGHTITMRLGGGLGYKYPSIFNEQAEQLHFSGVQPVDLNSTRIEQSAGANLDLNYQQRFGEMGFSINQLFYYTRLTKPMILTTVPGGYAFINAPGHIDTRGFETNIRLTYQDLKLFIGYTYADVNRHFSNQKEWMPLSARHRLNNVLMYEKEEKLKIGLEAYYFSPQRLSDAQTGRSYWICGAMVERLWEKFSIFLNFENILDTRQTRFDTIYTGSLLNPVFRDIYAPVDGFVINGGIKLKL